MIPELSSPRSSHTNIHGSGCCPTCEPGTGEEGSLSSSNNLEGQNPHISSAFKHWAIWFLTFFGIYSASSVCPFCGAPGCPVGAGGAALVGGFFATLMQYGKKILEKCKGIVAKDKR